MSYQGTLQSQKAQAAREFGTFVSQSPSTGARTKESALTVTYAQGLLDWYERAVADNGGQISSLPGSFLGSAAEGDARNDVSRGLALARAYSADIPESEIIRTIRGEYLSAAATHYFWDGLEIVARVLDNVNASETVWSHAGEVLADTPTKLGEVLGNVAESVAGGAGKAAGGLLSGVLRGIGIWTLGFIAVYALVKKA